MKRRRRDPRGAPAGALSTRSAPRPAGPERGAAGGRLVLAWLVARWLLFAVTLVYGVIGRRIYFDRCLHDDAFISFRYARNLARGAGLVMNPGERVEGYTNFLWTLLAAPVIALGGDPAWWSQITGAVLSLVLMAGAFVFAERRLGGGWTSLIAPAALAFNMAYVLESLSGLETMLFTVLVFAAYVAFVEERRAGDGPGGAWGAWCGVATMVRPEGGLVFGLLAAYAALGLWRGEPAARLRRAAIVYGVLVLPLVAWRFAYYGSPFPNTFYTKVGYTTAQLARGWRFMFHTVGWTLTAPLLLVAAVFSLVTLLLPLRAPGVPAPSATWTRLFSGRPRDEALAVGFLLWIGYFAYVLVVGGDYEPTVRFVMPVLALVYLLFQEGLRTFVLLFAATPRLVRAVVLLGTLAGGVACLNSSEQRFLLVLMTRGWPHSRERHHAELRAAGEWLRDNTPPGTVVALSSIGALPYYADRPIVDMMGLTDRHIGRLEIPNMGRGPSGHEKGDGAYVLGRRPDVILFDKGHIFPKEADSTQVYAGARGISEVEIARSSDFQRDYELRRAPTRAGILHFFARRRRPQ